ncbi:tol-pal system protein YbgF [Pseudohalocynthiibacter aestuariivivens]|uniref:Cell division coordinator CpoB n=1 Tax=Roseovarius pelagicus TaxID=2980108 RepID=A0ABY6DFU1_9RHOB|nr:MULTISPECIES: tol-pal system protein YbgF [Rhodobacterales]QIE46748.1 tol-pal system protein YbgF [Pseudohalocynthiibacter aestuariivivens]UXX84714.1 tol-pal system protein YbgF [Roseovarius pelagicus]
MRHYLPLVTACLLAMASPSLAQTRAETLADIRQEMTVLYVEVQKLKRELSTTGGAGGISTSGSVLDRVASIESELQRLTAKTEELELRVNRIVSDGTNRLGDLEFRLVELEGGDVSTLGETSTLGGGALPEGSAVSAVPGTTSPEQSDTAEMAVGEKADYDAAAAALTAGNYAEAATLFATFRENYPGGPLSDDAGLKRGEALEGAGELADAARAYLDLFSAAPQGPLAADALFRLGRALGRLGQTEEACLTLAEVEVRYPSATAVADANSAMQNLGCQ